MKNCIFPSFTILLLLVGCSNNDEDVLGSFVTNPKVTLGFENTGSNVVKEAIKRLTWQMEINEKEIKLWMQNDEPLILSYSKEGNYLLAKISENSEHEMLVPFYVKDSGTIYGFSTVFFRSE